MASSFFTTGNPRDPFLRGTTALFWTIFGIAFVLALTILLVPYDTYLMISNYLQIITAVVGAAALVAAWFRYGKQELLLVSAGALALWGLANIAWYVSVLMGQRAAVFPSAIDAGIIVSIVILAFAFYRGLPRDPLGMPALVACLVVTLLVPLGIVVTQGAGLPALATLFYFLACGTLICTVVTGSWRERTQLTAGALLFALAFLAYPLREMFFITSAVFNVLGVLVFAGFSLMVIGLLVKTAPVS